VYQDNRIIRVDHTAFTDTTFYIRAKAAPVNGGETNYFYSSVITYSVLSLVPTNQEPRALDGTLTSSDKTFTPFTCTFSSTCTITYSFSSTTGTFTQISGLAVTTGVENSITVTHSSAISGVFAFYIMGSVSGIEKYSALMTYSIVTITATT
jgi:hypothetical protein